MDEDVLSSREIELEVRFRRVQAGTMETVRKNSELLQVTSTYIPLAKFSFYVLRDVSVG